MRLTLTKKEIEDLAYILYEVESHKEYGKRAVELVKRLSYEEEKYLNSITTKKRAATKAANNAKNNRSRRLIKKAIDSLKIDDKKVTLYSISKAANISYNTAKRHSDYISEIIKPTLNV
jgi:hypothetical protein